MSKNQAKEIINDLLLEAGIHINGDKPWDIKVHNEALYERVIKQGALGLGESYMDGWWDVDKLNEFFFRALKAGSDQKIKDNKLLLLKILFIRLSNLFNRSRALEVGRIHYDLGNDLYSNMLGEKLVYTCGYWKNAKNLDKAQEDKLRLTCEKLYLKPGMTLLDIGCGWGELAKFAAKNYGVKVVGITISKEQCEFARKLCEGLPVEIRMQDYRDVDQKFDRLVSLGMFEHVGYLNYRSYMQTAFNCLNDDGLFLLHTIGDNVSEISVNEWTEKYIFPNSMLPSIAQLGRSFENLFVMEDWHNFGTDYAKTLLAWHMNFNDHWPELKERYDERFYRMWNYYLLSSSGAFQARYIQLWQIVLSKQGQRIDGYAPIR